MDENKEMELSNESISGEGCMLVNAEEIQSVDIRGVFSKETLPSGWRITVQRACDVTINYKSSMRKTDVVMGENDQIERDGDTLFLIKKQVVESYQEEKSVSPLAMKLNKIRASASPVSAGTGKSPVPSPPQSR